MSWFHTAGGKYNIEDQWLGVDFARLFLEDRDIADLVFIHEYVHSVLAHSDFTQGTRTAFQNLEQFKHLSDEQRDEIKKLLYQGQWFAQEDYASYMQTRSLVLKLERKMPWIGLEIPSIQSVWKLLKSLASCSTGSH